MRLLLWIIICLLFSQIPIRSLGYGQASKELNVSGVFTLREIFLKIERVTGKRVYYSNTIIDEGKRVLVNFNNESVEQLMGQLFGYGDLEWFIGDEFIAIRKSKIGMASILLMNPDSSITVTGTVINESGQPINGASVLVKNTQIGTTTKYDGTFVVKNVPLNTSLIISNISYLTQEMQLKGKANLGLITLKEHITILDETQIIAYGKTTQRLNVGNVVSIKSTDIENQPINNPLYALQGRVPGLQVTPKTGLPGGAINLQIRGRNSLNSETEPLIVIDGLPIVNNITGLGHPGFLTNAGDQMSALNFINSNDIESINILKDADATSIYGSRGANGAILITTKRGKPGQTRIDINAQSGWANVEKRMDLLNTEQYLAFRKESFANLELDYLGYPLTPFIADLRFWDQHRYTDWQKELIGKTAGYRDLQGSVSGGTPLIQYMIGGNYHKETTVFDENSSDQKGSAHMSLTVNSINDKFKATVSSLYMVDRNKLPGIDFTSAALTLPPNAPALYGQNDALNWELFPSGNRSWENPYAELYRTYDASVNNLIANAEFNYKPFPFLTIKTQVGYNELMGNSFRAISPFRGRSPDDFGQTASAAFNTNGIKNVSVEPQISYAGHIGKGVLDVLGGASIQNTTRQNQLIIADGFTSDALLHSLGAAASYPLMSNTSSQYKYVAIFGRAFYNWGNKYLLNLTARRDGSSRFGPGNQFGNFASIGAGWIFTEENFVKSNIPFLTYGKLRFSYGSSGNDGIGDYAYLERYEPIDASDPYLGVRGYRTKGVFNSSYAWEVTRKMEVGLEAELLGERIFASLSYFRNRSDNQLDPYPYPSIIGPGAAVVNIPAKVQNMGLEIMINTQNIKRNDFTWSTAFNFSRNRNKLLSYPIDGNTPYYNSIIGQPFYGEALVYQSAGVDPVTGKYQFTSVDGKIVFNPTDPTRLDGGRHKRIYIEPKFSGGLSNTVRYKGFQLDLFFQFTKQMGRNPISENLNRAGRVAVNLPKEYLNRWQKEGDIAEIQRNGYNPLLSYLKSNGWITSSDWNYVDASFIRLKNLSLSFSIPNSIIRRMKLQNLKIYVHGQNLLTFTKYKGLDPESRSVSSLPPLRVLTTGLQLIL